MKRNILLPALCCLLLPIVGSCSPPEEHLDVKRISRAVAYSLPLYHLEHLPFDETIATNAFDLFIDSLDPAHCYFLQSDVDAFRLRAPELAKRLKKGDVSFATETFSLLMKRIQDRTDYVDRLLEKGFDLTKSETFLWDRKDAPWPKNRAEWDEIWRKRVKSEYVARIVAKQVYDADATNETAEAAGVATNGNDSEEYDEFAEYADLSPEEFVRERYKQFKLAMETFDEEMLLQRYLNAFCHVYDPHTDYMSPSSLEDFNINMKLSLVGIGAMLRSDDGAAKIVRIIPGGPAERDGRLSPGDKIIAVAQGDEKPVSILHWPLYKAVRLIRGEKGTTVTLVVIPASDRSGTLTKTIRIVRDEVKLEEQAAKSKTYDLVANGRTNRLGVIVLPDFYADFKATSQNKRDARRTSTDVRRLLNDLRAKQVEGLILDLRNNGGGSLVEAIETAGFFIASGPVVQVRDRSGVQVLPDANPDIEYAGPLVVLVNRLSASASEILAAAMQDYERAVIVGDEKTHGKGTVQTLIALGNARRGSLKVTTAGFYRIDGGSTQLKGVVPDVIIPDYLDVMDLGEESLRHALPWDVVKPALYRTCGLDSALLASLREKSSKRLAENAEYQTLLEKRARLKKRFDTKTISLSLEKRIADAEEEKELDDLQNGEFLDESTEEKNDKEDVILNETLLILADLIEETAKEPKP